MIAGDFRHCETLQQFYGEIVALQCKAHGADYCAHHYVINACVATALFANRMDTNSFGEYYEIPDPMIIYRELGVNQGATAAAAALAGARILQLVDISLKPFEPQRHLFDLPDLVVGTYEKSSIDAELAAGLGWCDVLFVDTVHDPDHVRKELKLHAPKTKSAIIIHDTGTFPEIHRAAVETLKSSWDSVQHDLRGCGHSVFFKKPR